MSRKRSVDTSDWVTRGSAFMRPEQAAMLDEDEALGGFWFLAVPGAVDASEVTDEVPVDGIREAKIDFQHVRIFRIRQSDLDAAGGKSRVLDYFEHEGDDALGADYWTSEDREDWGPGHIWFDHRWEWLPGEPTSKNPEGES